jgi:hypothetical protein
MNAELTQKLVKRFPVLYQDYDSPMTQTCMCWGFDHSDGWFEIIWQLSLAIEEELGYSWPRKRWYLFKKRFFRSWNKFIYALSPVRQDKRKQEGSGTKEDPLHWVVTEQAPRDWLARLAWRVLPPLRFDDYRPARLQRLGFKAFVQWPYTGLAVVQVKEKFGTLRFYHPGNDAIDRCDWRDDSTPAPQRASGEGKANVLTIVVCVTDDVVEFAGTGMPAKALLACGIVEEVK